MENVNKEENQPLREEEKSPGAGKRIGYCLLAVGLAVLCFVMQVVALMVVIIPLLVINILNGSIDMSNSEAYMAAYMELVQNSSSMGILLYHIVGVLFFGLWYRFSFKKPRPSLKSGIQNMTGKAVLLAVGCGVCMCFFANATLIVETYLAPSIVETYMELAEAAGLGVDVLAIIATILLAPIGEEFLCRGLIFKYAKKGLGSFWAANILQAFLFGCIHGNWVQGIYAFFIGLVLGYLVEKYHTLLPAMILHFVLNLSSSTWIPYLFNAMFGEDTPSLAVGFVMLAVSAVIVIALLYWERRGKEYSGEKQQG